MWRVWWPSEIVLNANVEFLGQDIVYFNSIACRQPWPSHDWGTAFGVLNIWFQICTVLVLGEPILGSRFRPPFDMSLSAVFYALSLSNIVLLVARLGDAQTVTPRQSSKAAIRAGKSTTRGHVSA